MRTEYYSLDNIYEMSEELSAPYLFIFGQRSNGKSYSVKKKCIEDYFKKGYMTVLLRRWDIDLQNQKLYYNDMDSVVKKYSHNKYDGIMMYGNFFYFYKNVENDKGEIKLERGEIFGMCAALNIAEHYKSMAFQSEKTVYKNIIYEEILTDGVYLRDEPNKLQQFVSTICRNEIEDFRVYLIANNVSKVSPFLDEWFTRAKTQKQGTIDIYRYSKENEEEIILLCEYCETTNLRKGKKSIFFGNASKQIESGEWQVDEYPKLNELGDLDFKDLYVKYVVVFNFLDFYFKINLCKRPDNGEYLLYVYPCKEYNCNTNRIITNKFSSNPYVTTWFKTDIKVEKFMLDLLKENKILYASNACGTDFNQCLQNYKSLK